MLTETPFFIFSLASFTLFTFFKIVNINLLFSFETNAKPFSIILSLNIAIILFPIIFTIALSLSSFLTSENLTISPFFIDFGLLFIIELKYLLIFIIKNLKNYKIKESLLLSFFLSL